MSADRPGSGVLLVATAVLLLAGCGSSGSGQSGSAFTFLTVDLATVGAVNSNLDFPNVSTTVCATLRNNLKNPTVTAPTSLDDILITSYTVTIRRFDDGQPPGPFTFNTAFTAPAGRVDATSGIGGNTARVLVVIVPAGAKREAPLHNPRPRLPLNTQADFVFNGRDGRGQRHTAQASVTLVFIADDSTAETIPACT